MFASSAFAFWRGSIIFTFKFVKTKFHSGRVRLYFQPGLVAFGASQSNFNYSQVVDIRSETEVSFTVPYINTKPWCLLDTGTPINTISEINFTGVLYMEVLNELKANSSVGASINVLVEVAGGPDYELAAPCAPIIQPVLITASQRAAASLFRIRAQVGETEAREDVQSGSINSDQLGQSTLSAPWALNLAMHGEKVLSLRQLLKRSSNSASITLTTSGGLIISPFSPQLNYNRTATGTLVVTPHSFLDYFGNLYAFWRGSVNLKIIPNSFESSRATVSALLAYPRVSGTDPSNPYPSATTLVSSGSLVSNSRSSGPVQVIFQDLEGCIDITCPYYSQMHMSPVSDYTFNDTNVRLGLYPPYLVSITNLNADTYTIYRSAADSYQLAYLLGPPLCEFVSS